MINRNISLELPRETTSFTHDDGNQWDDENDKDVDDDNDDHNDDEDKDDNQNDDDDVHLSGSTQGLQPHCEKSQQSVNTSVSQNLQMVI